MLDIGRVGVNRGYVVVMMRGAYFGSEVYVRKDIPSKELKKHTFSKNIEAIFLEINLRKSKLLLVGTYHSTHLLYGTSDKDFFQEMGISFDVYSNYDKFLLAGDFNVQEEENSLQEFLDDFSAKNLVKEQTCFKSLENPSCINLFVTNSYQSFQNTMTISTGLSDFHCMVVTVLKTTFPKAKPKVVPYMDFSKFDEHEFLRDIQEKLSNIPRGNYGSFERVFLQALNHHAPWKQKIVRANQKTYVTKQLRKAIMHRSYLENKYYQYRTPEYGRAYKRQKIIAIDFTKEKERNIIPI